MSGNLIIHLKSNERIFVNGGVIKVDRKVALEFLNDVVFLLESHVIQHDDATTPLKRLYFIIQSMLIDPGSSDVARGVFDHFFSGLFLSFKSRDVLEGLVEIKGLVHANRPFDALKKIRVLFPVEDKLLRAGTT